MVVRKSQQWIYDNLRSWNRYVDITTTALVGRDKWPHELVYVDIFAGPGGLQFESSHRIIGSPFVAVQAAKTFTKILLCEVVPELSEACERRIRALATIQTVHVSAADCNQLIQAVADEIPPDALTVAFVDPTGLDASLEVLRTLTTDCRVDLLILFPDYRDIIRNVEKTYSVQPDLNLDLVLGPDSGWRERWSSHSD